MRRRRYRKPKIKNVKGYWIAQFRDLGGTKRKVSLGPVKTTRKSDAEERLATILEPINSRRDEPSPEIKFGPFVRQIYLPFYSRKWKRSTAATNGPNSISGDGSSRLELMGSRILASLSSASHFLVTFTGPNETFRLVPPRSRY